jgi:hypothetical protein
MSGFCRWWECAYLKVYMADPAASSEYRTAVDAVAPDVAHIDLFAVDDAILALLAYRLARALLLDTDSNAEPSPSHLPTSA